MGIHHSDCLPDTAGYDDPNKFANADDKLCQSYGLKFGTSEYADCRVRLTAQHQGAEPPLARIIHDADERVEEHDVEAVATGEA